MRAPLAFLALVSLAACRTTGTSAIPDPDTHVQPSRSAGPSSTLASAVSEKIGTDPGGVGRGTPLVPRRGDELAAFAAGCFWGVEDTFRHVPGVVATAVGFTDGHTDDPSYEQVCTHTTGHAETVLVEFDPSRVTYDTLLNVFFENHDPTTLNRQGPDYGDQYRSAVFFFSPSQEAAANAAKARKQQGLSKTVVTEIAPIGRFWRAEEYHQQYDEKTGTHSCPLPKGLPHRT
jgi:peptide-methionine (S)-S-oxide reductase